MTTIGLTLWWHEAWIVGLHGFLCRCLCTQVSSLFSQHENENENSRCLWIHVNMRKCCRGFICSPSGIRHRCCLSAEYLLHPSSELPYLLVGNAIDLGQRFRIPAAVHSADLPAAGGAFCKYLGHPSRAMAQCWPEHSSIGQVEMPDAFPYSF